jgi:hypothetical protein
MFRPFVLAHHGRAYFDGKRFIVLEWKDAIAGALEPWLLEVDRADDVQVFRQLIEWKLGAVWRGEKAETWRSELLRRVKQANNRHQRRTELTKLDVFGARLDEPTAIALYEIDPDAARSFILRHLPADVLGRAKPMRALEARAKTGGDEELWSALFRRTSSLEEWRAEVLRVAEQAPPERLVAELEARHTLAWRAKVGPTFIELLERRGRAALPYVMRHLVQIYGRSLFDTNGFRRLLALAENEGWLDLWGGLLRISSAGQEYDLEVRRLATDRAIDEREAKKRLSILSGASAEWNFGPFALMRRPVLSDETAVQLYRRFPELVRGSFKDHVAPSFHSSYPSLIEAAIAAGDDALLDFLASRLATRDERFFGWSKATEAAVERVAEHYQERLRDPDRFAGRAAAVLGQIPAFTIFDYGRLIRSNRLARLLFERSTRAYLAEPAILRDLLEAPQIHVQALAFRTLAADDPRARAAAADALDLLQATLLRPLHRRTRILAFAALANAGEHPDQARRIVERAKQALDLPDTKYPKEELIGLIGRLYARHPGLASPREQRVVYRRATAR